VPADASAHDSSARGFPRIAVPGLDDGCCRGRRARVPAR